jgi:predicted GIY-YIG superfamily endonuclease
MTTEELRKTIESLRARLPLWSIYVLINQHKEEIYFGVSRDPKERILSGHASGNTVSLSHWNFAEDTIVAELIKQNLTQSEASELAHSYEKVKEFNGYNVIQTAGI